MAETVRAIMFSFFIGHGYQPYQADAIIKSAWLESRLQHCVVARSGSAFLWQWVGARRRNMQRFAGTNGCPSVEQQLRFLDHELHREPFSVFFRAPPHRAFAVFRSCFEGGRC